MRKSLILSLLGAALLGGSCTNIDCPLDSIVVMTSTLYASETGAPMRLADSLSVRPAGRDTLLLHRAQGIDRFALPLRSKAGTDTLLLRFSDASGAQAEDTLFVTHDSFAHFENLDCPANVFHRIRDVRHTSHALSRFPLTLDSVGIVRALVDYDDYENLRIYLRSTSSH